MTDKDLLPCPFCGGRAYTYFGKDDEEPGANYVWCAACDGCGCTLESRAETKGKAIEAWNRRVKNDS